MKEVISKPESFKNTTIKEEHNYVSEQLPKTIFPDNVCYWFERKGHLIGSQKGKAKKFIQLNLLREIGPDKYECLPLPGNKQTHILEKVNNQWSCTCQRNKRLGKVCSHIDAIRMKLFMQNWNKGGY